MLGDEFNTSGVTDGDNKRKNRHDIENRLVILESDLRKFLAQRETLTMQERRARKEESRIQIEIEDKVSQLKKLEFEIQELERQIQKLKKELNVL